MTTRRQWITRGFEQFRQGSFDNAGQNLYVSRNGLLQRIHHTDINSDGYVDIVLCNSQNHWERPPTYVYPDPLGSGMKVELPSDGCLSAAVCDLNGDGYDDLVLAMSYNGSRLELNAMIYYGSPEGLSERYRVQIPASRATSVCCGDFNGDGKPDIAFMCSGKLRIFYQTELGFEREKLVDLDIEADQIAAADIDGDGYCDIYALTADGRALVYWGGAEGISADACTQVAAEDREAEKNADVDDATAETEAIHQTPPLAKVITLDGQPHLFVPGKQRATLIPARDDRSFGEPLVFACPKALSVACGDVNGDGHEDLVFASRGVSEGEQCSWVYWGGADGFDESRRTALPTYCACDVALGDLDGDGCDDIALCQDRTEESFDFHSLIYRGGPDGPQPDPVQIESRDARRIFIANSSGSDLPQVIVANHRARRVGGDVDPVAYLGGPDGFCAERNVHFKGRDAVDAVCCDLDDDGLPDIVTANCSENAVNLDPGSFLFKAAADGFSYEPSTIFPTSRAHGVCCADLNKDGYLDLVFVGFHFSELQVYYGGPDGFDVDNPVRINMEIEGEKMDEPRWIYLADLNNDGWLDLVIPQIGNGRSLVLWGGPDGFSMERRQMLAAFHAACVQAADLNGNGYLDLILGGHTPGLQGPHDSFVYVYWNGPDGLRDDRRTQLPAAGINAIGVADFNRDGHLDIFIANYHDGRVRDIDSYIYWGSPQGFSAENRQRLFMHSASGAVPIDFNEDGWVDLAVAYHKVGNDHVGHSAIWWNGPEGFSERNVTTLPSNGPHGMTRTGTGNQRDLGPEEYYVSAPHELPAGASVSSIVWDAEVPAKTWVKAQLRIASSPDELEGARWSGPAGESTWFHSDDTVASLGEGGWVQYRLALGAHGGGNTPRVRAVTVELSEV